MKTRKRIYTFLFTILLIGLNNGCQNSVWTVHPLSTKNNLLGVCFSSADTGTIVGIAGTILLTTDGGETWSSMSGGNGPVYWGISFSDSRNGWIVGNNGTILHSSDGGITWNRQSVRTSENFSRIFCLDSLTAWIVGDNGIIINTGDGGKTWTRQMSLVSTRLWDVFFTNPDTGIAVGGGCNFCYGPPVFGGYILKTTDGGGKWTIQKLDTNVFGFYGIEFIDPQRGTVVGAGGTILNTNDGGNSWSEQISGTTSDLWDVFFINADTGYVAGGNVRYADSTYGGTILRSTNGGSAWVEQEIPVQNALYQIFFTRPGRGIATGFNGTILVTQPSGETHLRR